MQASNNNFFKMAIESQELIFPETIPFLNEALHDNEKKRRKLNSILKKYVNFRLPKKTVTYYNSLFQEAEKAVKGQFKSPSTKPTIQHVAFREWVQGSVHKQFEVRWNPTPIDWHQNHVDRA